MRVGEAALDAAQQLDLQTAAGSSQVAGQQDAGRPPPGEAQLGHCSCLPLPPPSSEEMGAANLPQGTKRACRCWPLSMLAIQAQDTIARLEGAGTNSRN